MKESNDKDLVIVTVLLICIAAMIVPGVQDSAMQLAEKALYGLFGIAVGKVMK